MEVIPDAKVTGSSDNTVIIIIERCRVFILYTYWTIMV
jgi:hypothetical protein